MENKKVIGFKGFDKNLKCKDFQYSIGETYETEEVELCKKGFHFCENPFNVFSYYPPSNSRYCTVEADGEIESDVYGGKSVCSRITIGSELQLNDFVKAGVKFLLDSVKKEKASINTGYYSVATNTGYYSVATNTGDYSVATVKGNESIAIVTGKHSKVSGALGCWIVLTERGEWDGKVHPILDVKAFKVDGVTIKADTYYQLVNGKAEEVDDGSETD